MSNSSSHLCLWIIFFYDQHLRIDGIPSTSIGSGLKAHGGGARRKANDSASHRRDNGTGGGGGLKKNRSKTQCRRMTHCHRLAGIEHGPSRASSGFGQCMHRGQRYCLQEQASAASGKGHETIAGRGQETYRKLRATTVGSKCSN